MKAAVELYEPGKSGIPQGMMKDLFADIAWRWWREYNDKVWLKIGLGPVAIVRRVRHLKVVFVWMTGTEPPFPK